MKIIRTALFASALFSLSLPTVCTAGGGEFMNLMLSDTGSESGRPAVTLRKKADFITLQLTLVNDSRLSASRLVEIRNTVRMALASANADGRIVLQDGRRTIDEDNFRVDPEDARNDTSIFRLFLAIPIAEGESAEKLTDDLIAFARKLKVEGRTLITYGKPGLSIKDVERFRMELVNAIAEDIARTRAAFGEGVEFSVTGLDRELGVRAVSSDEVVIFLNYDFALQSPAKE